MGRTERDQQPSDVGDEGIGQSLLIGGLILLFLVAVGGLIYFMMTG